MVGPVGQNPVDPLKLSVVIPCYNERATVENLLERVRAVDLLGWELEVIVVDDASTDGTRELLRSLGEKIDHLVVHERNRGKGAALRSGFRKASGDYVLVQDADLEYDPAEYALLLQPVVQAEADVVYGSRFLGTGFHRVLYFWHSLGNGFLTQLSNIFSNLNLTDMETCFKVFRRSLLSSIRLTEEGFGIEPELTIKLARLRGVRFFEVGISYNGRTYDEGKKIGWRDGVEAVACILRFGLTAPWKSTPAPDPVLGAKLRALREMLGTAPEEGAKMEAKEGHASE